MSIIFLILLVMLTPRAKMRQNMTETYHGVSRGADEQLNQHFAPSYLTVSTKSWGRILSCWSHSLSFFLSLSLSVCVCALLGSSVRCHNTQQSKWRSQSKAIKWQGKCCITNERFGPCFMHPNVACFMSSNVLVKLEWTLKTLSLEING